MDLDVKPGVRVVRGPDWKWGNQDGGDGHVGTVVEVKTAETPAENHVASRVVLVQWDNGNRCNYRCGIEGKHDLLMYDNGPASVIHHNIVCDSCREHGIQGFRWQCSKCYDFDLCTKCYMSAKHSLEHPFNRFEAPNKPRILMPPRGIEKRIQAKGLFADAVVVRGHDWIWGDQDGVNGSKGKLRIIKGWENDSYRSVAEVFWPQTNKPNVYRVGHKGKVDIKADSPGDGLLYYPNHLPVLGKPYDIEIQRQSSTTQQQQQTPPATATEGKSEEGGAKTKDEAPKGEEKSGVETFADGDLVRIQLDLELLKVMQEGHGGWNDGMVDILTRAGTVHSVLANGDLRVRFGKRTWTLNPAALTKIAHHKKGDAVRIIDDMSTVYNLQEGHGGWVDDMALALGQVGRVVNVFPTGDTRVSVNGRVWTFNPMCVVLAPGENPPEVSSEEDISAPEDMDMQLRLLSLLENPAVVVAAAANGEETVMREFLTKHPNEVNTVAAGKAAIHCASVAGNMKILKCLLEFNADVEIEDEDGDRPLHLCAYGDEEEAAELLMQHNADINAISRRGATPLIIAAVKGHTSVLKKFLESPVIDLTLQDQDGNNALHHAVIGQRHTVISALLDAGFDTQLVNFRLFTPIHDAARVGFLPGMDLFIKHDPSCVNNQKDDGYTPLHLAALNNHLDVLTTMLDLDECNIDAVTNDLQTALHIAVHQGHGSVVERLVGFGANLNLQDKDGDTPLHITLMRETLQTISADSPRMEKLRKNYNMDEGSGTGGGVVACFLVQEGAELYIQNHKGNAPLLICSPDVAALVTKFVDDSKDERSTFWGSLRSIGKGVLQAETGNNPPVASYRKVKQVSPPVTPMKKLSVSESTPATSTPMGAIPSPMGATPTTMGATPTTMGATPTTTSTADTDSAEECMLCDERVDIILRPCNHAVVCRECSVVVKKCPQCKRKVSSIDDLTPSLPICPMCEEEEASVTLKPCDHKFCTVCSARLKKCPECRVVIELKVGLPDTSRSQASVTASITGGQGQSLCEICCERDRDTVLTCGHRFCNQCSHKVDNCPVCRKFIMQRIQIFS